MPNVIIETSHQDLITKPDNLLARINEALWQSGQFKLQADIKARIYTPNHVLIGLSSGNNEAFVFVNFYLMPGRDDDTIKVLAESIAQSIKEHIAEFEASTLQSKLQICVNPIILSDNYVKQII